VAATAFTLSDADALAPRLRLVETSGPKKPVSATPASTKAYRHAEGAFRVPISIEWSVREHTPRADFDMLLRNPDRDNCAVYFGRDHEAVTRKGLKTDLEERVARLTRGKAGASTEWLRIGPAQGVLVGVYDPESRGMLWHFCLDHRNRIYYIDLESLPGSGRRALPPRIREMIQGMVFE
jgi:hypothetical protein